MWERLYKALLNQLGEDNWIDWSRVSLDSTSVAGPGAVRRSAPTRRIAANGARSATFCAMGAASFVARWSATNVQGSTVFEKLLDEGAPWEAARHRSATLF